ncbi:Cytoadherence-linked asexual protein, putative, partial [Plasmodium malariae]
TQFRRFTTDKVLKFIRKKLINIERTGYMEESIKARLQAKNDSDNPLLQNFKGNISMLSPQVTDALLKDAYLVYVDDNSFFDGLDEDEKFLNDKNSISFNYSEEL